MSGDVADAGEYACYANINNTFNLEKYTGSTDLTVLGEGAHWWQIIRITYTLHTHHTHTSHTHYIHITNTHHINITYTSHTHHIHDLPTSTTHSIQRSTVYTGSTNSTVLDKGANIQITYSSHANINNRFYSDHDQ